MANNLIHKALRYVYLHGWLYRKIDDKHRQRLAMIKSRGDEVRVVFFAMSVAMWRYQHLFELMSKDSRFKPVVVISPSVDYTPDQQTADVESLRKYFQDNNLVSRIVDFNSTKVFDVQTYTAITFLTRKRQDSIEYSRIKHGQPVPDFLERATYTSNLYSDLNVKKWRLFYCSF